MAFLSWFCYNKFSLQIVVRVKGARQETPSLLAFVSTTLSKCKYDSKNVWHILSERDFEHILFKIFVLFSFLYTAQGAKANRAPKADQFLPHVILKLQKATPKIDDSSGIITSWTVSKASPSLVLAFSQM